MSKDVAVERPAIDDDAMVQALTTPKCGGCGSSC